MHAVHGIPLPASSGLLAAPYTDTFIVWGLTIENANTAGGGTVIVRDGSSAGRIVAAASAVAQAGSVPGVADQDFHAGRVVNNGGYIEIDGTTVTGTLWVS